MNSNLSNRKLLLIQEIFKLNNETSFAKVEKLVKEVRLSDDIEKFKKEIHDKAPYPNLENGANKSYSTLWF